MQGSPTCYARASLALLFLFLAGCGPGERSSEAGGVQVDTLPGGAVQVRSTGQGVWQSDEATPWRLEEEVRIGQLDGDPSYLFGSARNVIPGRNGLIWVLDSQARELRLFDASGRFVRTAAGPGEGPGELASNPCAFPGPNEEVWVEDARRSWQRFDPDGAFLGTLRATSNLGCGVRLWTPDGRFLVVNTVPGPNPGAYFVVYRMGSDGALVAGDTIHPPETERAPSVTWVSADGRYRVTNTVPFVPRSTAFLLSDGHFWVSDGTGAYVIRKQPHAGDTLLIVRRDHVPVPIPGSARDQAILASRPDDMTPESGFDAEQVPRIYPPFDSYLTGSDGTLWVRRTLANGAHGLDVFGPDGRYLGQVEVPADFARIQLHAITAEHVFGTARDELDVSYVVRLGIGKPGG